MSIFSPYPYIVFILISLSMNTPTFLYTLWFILGLRVSLPCLFSIQGLGFPFLSI